jgi:hypothetical protein
MFVAVPGFPLPTGALTSGAGAVAPHATATSAARANLRLTFPSMKTGAAEHGEMSQTMKA